MDRARPQIDQSEGGSDRDEVLLHDSPRSDAAKSCIIIVSDSWKPCGKTGRARRARGGRTMGLPTSEVRVSRTKVGGEDAAPPML
jgi:hypothetical protein